MSVPLCLSVLSVFISVYLWLNSLDAAKCLARSFESLRFLVVRSSVIRAYPRDPATPLMLDYMFA